MTANGTDPLTLAARLGVLTYLADRSREPGWRRGR
jgi:hypothetical protein